MKVLEPEREFFIDNLLVRIRHGSLNSLFQALEPDTCDRYELDRITIAPTHPDFAPSHPHLSLSLPHLSLSLPHLSPSHPDQVLEPDTCDRYEPDRILRFTGAILNPQPSILNSQLSTLNPQPSTLIPQPSTLNPQPSTLNPQPFTGASTATDPWPFIDE